MKLPARAAVQSDIRRVPLGRSECSVPGDAHGIPNALATRFGKASIFMDVDNLLAGQRFDDELAKAVAASVKARVTY